jgi:alkylated DNA repair dioxygenase AlkB
MTTILTETSYVTVNNLPEDLSLSTDDFSDFWNQHPSNRHIIKIFGKECTTPRWFQVYGVSNYTYSGSTFPTQPITPFLQRYLDWANETDTSNDPHKYNMVLVNWYGSGNDYIGWHRDDEKQIVPDSDVMTISFGGERKFKIKYDPVKKNETKLKITHDYITKNNSYLIMGGTFQSEFKHHIPKSKTMTEPRISITFRKFK